MPDLPSSESFEPHQSTASDGLATAHGQSPTVLEKTQLDTDPSRRSPPGPREEPGAYGRYTLLREHALGGLGKVSLAKDTTLGRTVALKEIRADRQPGPEVVQRFVNEAAITAQLEHPGIVPIYTLDQDATGKPYYAMRFIAGQSLHAAIRVYHEHADPIVFRKLVNHFITVCNTIGYAHSKGIIHRDLKPENIMLGEYGETLVVDWGLAKKLSDKETAKQTDKETDGNTSAATGDSSSPCLLVSLSPCPPQEGTVLQTKEGAVMGTPAYMSPEQARGEVDRLGPATDIYALGAILYTLLTGRAPFPGNAFDVLPLVQLGTPPPSLTQVKKDVDRALAAICDKAMLPRVRERYASAPELVADLERWLADEPTLVYAGTWAVRARRSMRKHRTLVASGLILLGSLAALALGAAVLSEQGRQQVLAEKDNTEKQRQEAVTARERERTAKLKARQRVRALSAEEHLRGLEQQKHLTKEQQELLRTLAEFYRECAAEAAETEAELAQQAQDYFQLGWMLERLGQPREALGAYGDAVRVAEKLVTAHPVVVTYQDDLARAFNNLGVLQLNAARDPAAAEASYLRARRLYEQLSTAQPKDPDQQANLAKTWNNLGSLQQARKRPQEARRSYEQARQIFDALSVAHPRNLVYQANLAATWNNLGLLQESQGQGQGAEYSYLQACRVMEKVCAAQPTVSDNAVHLAGMYGNLGNLLRDQKRYDDALLHYDKSLTAFATVLQRQPRHPSARVFFRNTVWGRALALEEVGRFAEAVRDWGQALALDEDLSQGRFHRRRQQALQQALRQASLLARLGWCQPAAHCVNLLSTLSDLPADTWPQLARVLALCAATPGGWFLSPPTPHERERYALQAVELLRRARAGGFFTATMQAAGWHHDRELMPLVSRPEIRQLLRSAAP